MRNTRHPGLPNYTGPNEGWALWVHHWRPFEYCTDFAGRLAYIREHKPTQEQPLRMQALIYLDPVEVPYALFQAGTAYAQAEAARAQARTAYVRAEMTQAVTAFGQAVTAFGQARRALGQGRSALGQAGTAYAQARTALAQAGTAYDQARTALAQASTAYDQAEAAYGQAEAEAAPTILALCERYTPGLYEDGALRFPENDTRCPART